jgi:hypothetical protein
MDPTLISLHTHLQTYFDVTECRRLNRLRSLQQHHHVAHVVVNSAHVFVIVETPKTTGRERLDNYGYRQGPLAGCRGGHEPWGSIECRKLLDQMNLSYSKHLTKETLEGFGAFEIGQEKIGRAHV